MEELNFTRHFTSELTFDLGSVFNNEKLNVAVHFSLLPSRDCVVSAVATRKGATIHLNGVSSKFDSKTDLFLKGSGVSILASLNTDANDNITGGSSSGFIEKEESGGTWTRYWWTKEVTAK